MLRNIRSSKWTIDKHCLHLKIDIQPIVNFDFIMSDLYVLMEFLISSSDDELILIEHKKRQNENKKLH